MKIAEVSSAREPENVALARDRWSSLNSIGIALSSLGKTEEAMDYHQQALKIAESSSARASENVEFARDLMASYWSLAVISEGENQKAWLRKALADLTVMHSRGVLAQSDEQYIAVAKAKLGIE